MQIGQEDSMQDKDAKKWAIHVLQREINMVGPTHFHKLDEACSTALYNYNCVRSDYFAGKSKQNSFQNTIYVFQQT